VHGRLDVWALQNEEFQAALRIARVRNLDDDQLFSLAVRHRDEVRDKLWAELGRPDGPRRSASYSLVPRLMWRTWKFRALMRG
jgi:uncharacterized protein YaeQ